MSLGNGRTIKIWREFWLPQDKPFSYYASNPSGISDVNAIVHSFVDGDGNWNCNLFGNLLPCNILLMIAAIKPLDINDGQDQVFWGWSKDGRFSSNLVYKYLMGFD